MRGTPFTAADDAAILNLAESPKVIAKRLGRTVGSVSSRRRRLLAETREPGRDRAGAMRLPKGRGAWLLAKTCGRCGEFLPASAYRKAASGYRQSYCKPCQSDATKDRLATQPEYAERFYNYVQDRHHDLQRTAKTTARNARKEWTGPEIEIAMRDDLSDKEKALMLGRTFYAVRHMIRKINAGDPAKTNLAGLGRTDG